MCVDLWNNGTEPPSGLNGAQVGQKEPKWAKRSSGNLLWTESRICSKSFPRRCCCVYRRQQIQVENEMECGDVVKRRSLKAMGEGLT